MMDEFPAAGGRSVTVEVKPGSILWILFASLFSIEVLLFLLDYFVNWQEFADRQSIRDMFSTTREHSIAGWFAATQTFVVAMVSGAILVLARASGASVTRQLCWLVITVVFAYLSLDDGAAIHEHLGGGLKNSPVIGDVIEGYPSYSWHIVILPVFLVVGLFMLFFLWIELANRNEKLGMLAAFTCFTIAVGQDFIEGTVEEYDWFLLNYGMDSSAILHFAKSLEECLEMLGMTLFLIVFLSHLLGTYRIITLRKI